MALSSAAAAKSYFETLGYGFPWFTDRGASRKADGSVQGFPYGVFQGDMRNVAGRRGDNRVRAVDELGQLDVYQDVTQENRLLFDRIYNDLQDATLTSAPKKVFRVQVTSAERPTPGQADELVRYTYSLIYKRAI